MQICLPILIIVNYNYLLFYLILCLFICYYLFIYYLLCIIIYNRAIGHAGGRTYLHLLPSVSASGPLCEGKEVERVSCRVACVRSPLFIHPPCTHGEKLLICQGTKSFGGKLLFRQRTQSLGENLPKYKIK
jgi:hypothetical protein